MGKGQKRGEKKSGKVVSIKIHFFPRPICLMLLSNLAMFAFAALKLNNMRKRVQKGNRRAEYGRCDAHYSASMQVLMHL